MATTAENGEMQLNILNRIEYLGNKLTDAVCDYFDCIKDKEVSNAVYYANGWKLVYDLEKDFITVILGIGASLEDIAKKNIYDQINAKVTEVKEFVKEKAIDFVIEAIEKGNMLLSDIADLMDLEWFSGINRNNITLGLETYKLITTYLKEYKVEGTNGNDLLYGTSGDNAVYGKDGNDVLIGGAGNDYLDGGNGTDTYIIGAADGNDTIYNYDTSADRKNDKIVFGEGIKASELVVSRNGNDMLISNSESGQITTLKNTYYSDYYKLYNLEFADESTAVIDYANTTLNITYKEPVQEIVEEPIEETTDEGVIAELVEENPTEAVTDTESLVDTDVLNDADDQTDISDASDIDSIVEESAQILTDFMNGDGITADENNTEDAENDGMAVIYETEDIDILTMTNLLVQEMSESSTAGVSGNEILSETDTQIQTPQLWID